MKRGPGTRREPILDNANAVQIRTVSIEEGARKGSTHEHNACQSIPLRDLGDVVPSGSAVRSDEGMLRLGNERRTPPGVVIMDLTDRNYNFVILARDKHGRFRAVEVGETYFTRRMTEFALAKRMPEVHAKGDAAFEQGDETGDRVSV